MVVLDKSGSSSGDSSSTSMELFPSKNKVKMVESSPKRKKRAKVLQIRGNFEEFGEGKIGDVMEAIRRSKVDLRLCGKDGVENQMTQIGSSLGGSSGHTAEQTMPYRTAPWLV